MERSIYSQHIVDMEHSVKQLLHFGAASAIITTNTAQGAVCPRSGRYFALQNTHVVVTG